jgi:hypothetical protein
MEKKPYLHFLNNLKYRAPLVGFGVACIHFVITCFGADLSNWGADFQSDFSVFRFIISLTLLVPSYVLLFLTEDMIDFGSHAIPFVLASSLFYGIVASFLATKNIILRVAGIVFICFLCVAGFGLTAALSLSEAN